MLHVLLLALLLLLQFLLLLHAFFFFGHFRNGCRLLDILPGHFRGGCYLLDFLSRELGFSILDLLLCCNSFRFHLSSLRPCSEIPFDIFIADEPLRWWNGNWFLRHMHRGGGCR